MSNSSPLSNVVKVVLFPEGPGFLFISTMARTGMSDVLLVRSLQDGQFYVRKQSKPRLITGGTRISSSEVRRILRLSHLSVIPTLVGWVEYQDELSSNCYITVMYSKLYNGGTLEDSKTHLEARQKLMPERCLWFMYSQMLSVMVSTIRAGILHSDGHLGNWFIEIKDDASLQLVLGDWGIAEDKPSIHGGNCDPSHCFPPCPTMTWWQSCDLMLNLFVVDNIRELGSIQRFSEAQGGLQGAAPASAPYLTLLLDTIKNNPPSNFHTGEDWFSMIERLSAWILQEAARLQESIDVSRNTDNRHELPLVSRNDSIPPFETTIAEIETLDEYQTPGLNPHFWRVAYIIGTMQEVVALDGQQERRGYEDHTAQELLRQDWIDGHARTIRIVRSLEGGTQQMQEHGLSDQKHDTGFEDFY